MAKAMGFINAMGLDKAASIEGSIIPRAAELDNMDDPEVKDFNRSAVGFEELLLLDGGCSLDFCCGADSFFAGAGAVLVEGFGLVVSFVDLLVLENKANRLDMPGIF